MCKSNKEEFVSEGVQQVSPFVEEYFELLERAHQLLAEKAKAYDVPLYTLAMRFADNIMAQDHKMAQDRKEVGE